MITVNVAQTAPSYVHFTNNRLVIAYGCMLQ